MIVRMRHQMSGTRNGQPWPAPGGNIDLSEAEAEILLKNQMAEEVNGSQEPPKTEEPKTETPKESPVKATPKKVPAKRGRPRKTPVTKAVER